MLSLAVLGSAGPVLRVPVELDRKEARQAARKELAQQIYQQAEPSLAERGLMRLLEFLSGLLDDAGRMSPGGYIGLLVLLLLLVAAVIAFRLKLGPLSRSAEQGEALFVGGSRASADYRAAADAHAAAGRWAEAVRERLRAVIRSLEERDLLEPRPGRTADEAAREAGAVLPECANSLLRAAQTFDEIWYGGRSARPEADQHLRQLDAQVRAARPLVAGHAAMTVR